MDTCIETVSVYRDGLNDENRKRDRDLNYSIQYTTQVVPSLNVLVARLQSFGNQNMVSLKLYPYPGYTGI
jgi:hypothetical protein